jgi:hypothetical protein
VQDNDALAVISFAGGDGVDLALAARISVEVDGTPGSNDMPGRMVFLTTPDGSQTPVEAMRINNAQNVTVTAGNLVIGTSGKGIDFSATPGTGTSELLADYEEGTWTPLMSANGQGSDNWTSSTAVGRYTKVGRLVTVECTYTYTAKQSVTGDYAFMTGLPFVPANSTNGFFYVGVNNSGGADTATYSGIFATTPRVQFVKDQDRSGAGNMTGGDFPAATRTITFQANYTV